MDVIHKHVYRRQTPHHPEYFPELPRFLPAVFFRGLHYHIDEHPYANPQQRRIAVLEGMPHDGVRLILNPIQADEECGGQVIK